MLPHSQEQDRLEETTRKILSGKQQVVSYAGTSQYQDFEGVGAGASACGLAALNCARIMFRNHQEIRRELDASAAVGASDARRLLNGVLCQQTAEEIISICSSWPSDKHLEVDELLKIPIFKHSFDIDKVRIHYALTEYTSFLEVLREMSSVKDIPVAAIITRSPEIVVCVRIPTTDSGDIFAVFDSHPRPTHPDGAGFIVNTSMDSSATYLNNLLSIDPKILADPSMRWQAQLFGQFSSHIITPNLSPLSRAGIDEILLESSITALRLQAELSNTRQRCEELTAENDRLKAEIEELELANEEATNTHHQCDAVDSDRPKTDDGRSKSGPGTNHGFQSSGILYQAHLVNGPPSWEASTSGSSTIKAPSVPAHSQDRLGPTLGLSEDIVSRLKMQYQEENRILAAERASLLAHETPTFQCCICFDDLRIDYLARMDNCKHSFCRDCLRAHVASTISQRRYPVLCPACMADNASEPTKIEENVLSHIGLTGESAELLRSLQIAPFSIALHCRKCEQTMFVDRKDHQESSTIACPLRGCGYVWCKSCERQIEIGGPQHSCDGSSELRHLMQKRGWKACPGCQTPIQKDSGCNHMTCLTPACNAHFCYLCGQLMIQSVVRREIERAVSGHYSRCTLFEYGRRR